MSRKEVATDPFELDELEGTEPRTLEEQIAHEAKLDASEKRQAELLVVMKRVLTPKQYRVVYLHFFEARKEEEIALLLGMSQQSVNNCLLGRYSKGQRIGGALARLGAAIGN